MAIAAAENFQLKWHSYGAYLHTSIATLLRSQSFSDITLATVDGRQIAAHRFILSACSSYMKQLLQTVYPGTNSHLPLVVVLPSEISYRILRILIEYMYSGEATVSYGQLDGILRAAHILGIRGLCREKGNHGNQIIQERYKRSSAEQQSFGRSDVANEASNKKTGSCTNGRENSSKHGQNGNGGTTKSSDQSESSMLCENPNKELDKSCESSNTKSDSMLTEGDVICQINGESSKNNVTDKSNSNAELNDISKVTVAFETTSDKHNTENRIDIDPMQLLVKQEPIEWEDTEVEMPMTVTHCSDDQMHTEMTIKPEIFHATDGGGGGDDDDDDDDDGVLYSPLSCDLCQKVFTTPAEWVRHIEAHPENQQQQQQQRGRRTGRQPRDLEIGSSMNQQAYTEFPPLRCELCQQVFTSPADWVRHIQTSHTEEQLALSNNSSTHASRFRRGGRKRCQICSKTFPSHASMLIHRRTHTGEKPYVCAVCGKVFNVKSNLLRHLRTLHDRIVSPSTVE